jgi:hypothetical protein
MLPVASLLLSPMPCPSPAMPAQRLKGGLHAPQVTGSCSGQILQLSDLSNWSHSFPPCSSHWWLTCLLCSNSGRCTSMSLELDLRVTCPLHSLNGFQDKTFPNLCLSSIQKHLDQWGECFGRRGARQVLGRAGLPHLPPPLHSRETDNLN